MSRVFVSERASGDLDEIWQYVAADNVNAADQLLSEIEDCIRMLVESPFLGRARDDVAEGFRSFPIGNYLILYQILTDAIGVVRVIHSARRLEDALQVDYDPPP